MLTSMHVLGLHVRPRSPRTSQNKIYTIMTYFAELEKQWPVEFLLAIEGNSLRVDFLLLKQEIIHSRSLLPLCASWAHTT